VKKFQSLSFLATLAIAIGMISWGSALQAQNTPSTDQTTPQTQQPSPEMPPASQQTPSAQQPSSQSPDANAPQSGSKSADPSAASTGTDTQTFSGTVVKQGDKYVLKDDAGKVYDIDHQTDVAKFDGKRVRVQGTLDANGKILVK
jgi:cytoskeletal protein RodZ